MRLGLLGRGVFRAARAVDERHLIVRNDRARGVPEVVRRADRRVRLGDNDLGLVRRELFELAAETVGHDNGLLARRGAGRSQLRTAQAVRDAVDDGVVHHADDRVDRVGLDRADVVIVLDAGVARDLRRVNAGLVEDVVENDAQILTLDARVRVEIAAGAAGDQTERIGCVYVGVVRVAEELLT